MRAITSLKLSRSIWTNLRSRQRLQRLGRVAGEVAHHADDEGQLPHDRGALGLDFVGDVDARLAHPGQLVVNAARLGSFRCSFHTSRRSRRFSRCSAEATNRRAERKTVNRKPCSDNPARQSSYRPARSALPAVGCPGAVSMACARAVIRQHLGQQFAAAACAPGGPHPPAYRPAANAARSCGSSRPAPPAGGSHPRASAAPAAPPPRRRRRPGRLPPPPRLAARGRLASGASRRLVQRPDQLARRSAASAPAPRSRAGRAQFA